MARRRFRPSTELRIYFLAIVMLCGFGALTAKLWWEQVARGKQWAQKIASRSEVTVRIPSVRGEIRDRSGVTLVANKASYDVDFYMPDIVRGFKAQGGKVPMTTYLGKVNSMLTEMREPDIVKIVNTSIVSRLHELDLAKDYNAERLQKHFRTNTEVPFTYLEAADFKTIAKFSEHDVGLPGVDISVRPVREYVYGALASHLLGFVGAPANIDRLPDVGQYTFYQPDVEGKSQVEKDLDRWIRGTPGVRVMQRNVKGVIEGETKRVPPKQGNNVYLTIDARIQYIAERALRDGGIGRGAAVVVNPKNGEVLAMASVPSYNPNDFIPSVSVDVWKKLNDDKTEPLNNRAILSYEPGSTFKTVTGLAGLRKGLTGKNTFTCSGGVQYGGKYMKCWVVDRHMAPHGTLTLPDALKHSCNAFFYQWGNAAGIDQIDAVGEALGLGHKTGVPLSGESPGILPGPEWLKNINPNERWSDGYTANVSIGQGSCLTSPLQMAMVTATIANRGISFDPKLIYRVLDQNGADVVDPDTGLLVAPHEPKVRADLHAAGITNEQIELIREGMRRVVMDNSGGTGRKAQIPGIVVAGKTGTAQAWREENGRRVKDNKTWFICFAPYQDPKYAICIMVEAGKSGGGTSAPIAQKILQESLALEKGWDPGLAWLEPAVGHLKAVDEVSYTKAALPTPDRAQEVDGEETADQGGPVVAKSKKKERQVQQTPDIRPKADQRGQVSRPPDTVRRAERVEEKRNFFQRFFGPRRESAPPPPKQQQPRGR